MNFFLLFCLALALSPLGSIRIGGPSAEAKYSLASWVAMLFAAGIGIGIMFYGVLEPMNHALRLPFDMQGLGIEETQSVAMAATLYHWAFHPWAVYAVVGLSLSFFCYNKSLPLLMRSALYPIFGERIWGWPGHIVDILAIFATLFGLATSLGYGAEQASGGIRYLSGLPDSSLIQIVLIAVITALALFSVLRGLDGGIKLQRSQYAHRRGSWFIRSPDDPHPDHLGQYSDIGLGLFVPLPTLSTWSGRTDFYYMHDWTTFYWAWWIAFSPFVGLFIARISTGRTVREFILGALIAPSFIFLTWMTIFGQTAMTNYFMDGATAVADSVRNFQPELTLFIFLEQLPLSEVTSLIGLVLVIIFFVTSMDSGSLVVDTMAAGGKTRTPVAQRIFWCCTLGMIGVSLLLGVA